MPGDVPYLVRHARHLYVIQLKLDTLRIDRDKFMHALRVENIGAGLHFRSLHLQSYYKKRFNFEKDSFPNASFISDRIISLPLYPKLHFNNVILVSKIVKKLVNFYSR